MLQLCNNFCPCLMRFVHANDLHQILFRYGVLENFICSECLDVPWKDCAKPKSIATDFRPVCDSCHVKLKAAYKKRSKPQCSLCKLRDAEMKSSVRFGSVKVRRGLVLKPLLCHAVCFMSVSSFALLALTLTVLPSVRCVQLATTGWKRVKPKKTLNRIQNDVLLQVK